eukprot:NODE_261_length_11439_cov_1.285538.p4 type:complete len:236 gc:universal NODE_261_length_11439_cov_1.285538:9990-10697(+)
MYLWILSLLAYDIAKYHEFENRRHAFYNDTKLVKAAECFEHKLPNCSFTDSKLVGMTSEISNLPIFTQYLETHKVKYILYQNDHFTIILNDKSPYYTGQNHKLAARSYAQLLLLPNARIYNAVTLNHTHLPLLYRMMDTAHRIFSLKRNRLRTAQKMRKIAYNTGNNLQLFKDEHIFITDNLITKKLKYYVHVHPTLSVGHLHIHGIFENLKHGSKDEAKNMPMDVIMAYLEHNK